MKDNKLEIPEERDVQSGKERPIFLELVGNFEVKLKNKTREEKIKIIKGEASLIEGDLDKNCFFDSKNISRKDLNCKRKKGNIRRYNKNNNKRNRINYKKNTFLIIIIMLFFNLIIPNNNMIEYKSSSITLKIQGSGFNNILSSSFQSIYYPNITYINGNIISINNFTQYFNEINNSIKLVWNNSINNCYRMFHGCSNIIEIDLSNFDTSEVSIMWSMFEGCSQLSSLNLSNIDTSQVTDMDSMFCGCSQLISLDLSNFKTSNVIWMNNMFSGCSQLSSLDLSNFNTTNVNYMNDMFSNCSQLSSLDLSNFNTSYVEDMYNMFSGCSQLSSLNLSNFNTSNVYYMNDMFSGCSQLSSLDLSNFNTSNVEDMNNMFSGCSQLSSLNLSNFNTSNVYYMNNMFSGCSHLSSLDLSNFNTSNAEDMNNMFSGCSKLEYINLNNFIGNNSLLLDDILNNAPINLVLCLSGSGAQILENLMDKNYYTLDCSVNWKINQKKIINKTDICFDNFNRGILYKFVYHGLYYENFINGNLTNNSTIKYCQCDINNCSSCSNISFIDLEYDLYEVEDNDNQNGYRKCYKDTTGYYLDMNDSIYKKCYYSCEKCEVQGNNNTHNCEKCSNDYPLEFKINNNYTNYSNCFQNCRYYYYFDENNDFFCTDNNTCPKKFPILIGIECQKDIKIINMDENLNNCLNNEKTNEKEIYCYDTILKDIEDIYSSRYFDTSDIDNGLDQIIEIDKTRVILSTTENQKNNINSDFTTIDLGDCEQSLRQAYNLSDDDTIYIKMLEISQEEMQVPKVEYDIYTKSNGKNLIKLSLNACQNTKISLLIPINVDNIDKLNSSSGYYNDLCYTATSDSGTDISLEDRKNEYPSKAPCQDGCDFSYYNDTLKKAKCACKAKESSSSFEDMKIDKNKLLENFKNLKNIVNVKLLKCLKVLFNKKGLIKNVGFYIFSTIFIFHIIILILFYQKRLNLLIDKIKCIIFAIKILKSKKGEEKIIGFKEVNDNNNYVNEIIIDDGNVQIKRKANKIRKNRYKVTKKEREKVLDISNKDDNSDNKIYINRNNNIVTDGNNKMEFKNYPQLYEIKKYESIMDYTEDEMNDLSYDLALKNDKRTYWQFYISLIKTKHEFIYAFVFNKDYNSRIIKIDLFVFGFGLNYAVNGLFFNDDTMHNVYENKGLFDISYQLPLIIYSSFISMFLSALVQILGLSNDAIISFKQSEEAQNVDKRGKKLIKMLKIKFVFYFILSFILLIAFFYYISIFDAVYKNTQFLLLQDTFIGFALSMVTPFVIYLIPGLFRLPALAAHNRRCVYNFSKLFTIL